MTLRRFLSSSLMAAYKVEVLPAPVGPVARIIPLSRRRRWLPAAEIAHELARLGPDTTGLAEELRATLTDTTDDLRW